MPYKSKRKCVYKKDTGKKVGCTKGDVKDYLAALAINVKTENMENKLEGGKGDKMTPKKIADKFDVKVKDVKKQIDYGTCVECEHTDDKQKAKEIATDHVAEFPDYYNRIHKMEKQAEKHWGKKEKANESKNLIKKLLRENLQPNKPKNLDNELIDYTLTEMKRH